MIEKAILPMVEPNSDEVVLVQWLKKEDDYVKKNEALVLVETTKAIFEVESEHEGILRKKLFSEGDIIKFTRTIALIGDREDELPDVNRIKKEEDSQDEQKEEPAATAPATSPLSSSEDKPVESDTHRILASPSARRIARENHIDLNNIRVEKGRRITKKEVLDYIEKSSRMEKATSEDQVKRVVIIGAGNGGTLVANILSYDETQKVVGFIDDNELLKGHTVMDIPVLGAVKNIYDLKRKDVFDKLIIAISTNMPFRKKVYIECVEQGFDFTNAVHPSAILDDNVTLGKGNVILSTAHIGFMTRIGNNNFISAHANIAHHCVLKDHSLISPGVCTSGTVKIGNSAILGTGVFIKSDLTIGNNVTVASGLTIFNNIPDNHVLKKKFDRDELPKPRRTG